MNITFTFDNGDVWSFDEFQKYLTEYFSSVGGKGSGCFGCFGISCENCMFRGEFIGDCDFPSSNDIELLQTVANKLHEWKMSHIITNLDHYGEELGWSEEQKKGIVDSICPFIYATSRCKRDIERRKSMNINLSKEFGVPEDVEFTLGENTMIYKIHKNILYVKFTCGWDKSGESINAINGREVRIVSVITDAEEVILENLPERYKEGWIARDGIGDKEIFAYSTEPYKKGVSYGMKEGSYVSLPYEHLFPTIQYDTGAKKISELLEQKKRSKE